MCVCKNLPFNKNDIFPDFLMAFPPDWDSVRLDVDSGVLDLIPSQVRLGSAETGGHLRDKLTLKVDAEVTS